jgi:hypothetical protein
MNIGGTIAPEILSKETTAMAVFSRYIDKLIDGFGQ